ncbi:MAG: hypothetical protein D6715_11440 [Calditrichaeota bacterium]|nr:MAG: hypothetical protein D6715_11440 [Calditrichota bacterium]
MPVQIPGGRSQIMILGILFISVAFVAAVVAAAGFWQVHRTGEEALYNLARRSFYLMGLGIVLSMGYLMIQIFAHNFQVNYVYSYSSRELNPFYLFSTFWAGQEGTFLLWLFYGTIYGLILLATVGRTRPLVLFYMMLVQVFILLILLAKNPFAMIWHVYDQVPVGFTPPDGAGLNPLLQNPWMVIHPPTLFVGYSSTMVVFAFVMDALARKDFQGWVKRAQPWAVFSAMILGTGIILGGYWAYVTLGWGGYWGWDPVENSSLVPWLLMVALVHGLMIQKKRGSLVRTNLLLGAGAFLAVLWGSFLTRSGVLADFSVHSFAESGLNLYLTAFIVVFSGLFLIHFFHSGILSRGGTPFGAGFLNRETGMFAGMFALMITAAFVLLGTSAPLYTRLFGKPQNVSTQFYNILSIPITILILLALIVAPVVAWNTPGLRNRRAVTLSALAGVLVTLVAFVLGIRQPMSLVLFYLAVVALSVNAEVVVRLLTRKPAKAGGYLAHVGVGIMIIGILTSSLYDRSEKLTLPQGVPQQSSLGYKVQFVGLVSAPDGKDRARLIVEGKLGRYEAYPRFYYSDYTQSYMANPDVKMGLTKDVYISPISFVPADQANQNVIELKKGESASSGPLGITFERFEVSMGAQQQKATAVLQVQVNQGNYPQTHTLKPSIWMKAGKLTSDVVQVPGTDYRLRIESVNASEGKLTLAVLNPTQEGGEARDVFAVELSEKPLISLVWLGTVVLVFGFALSLVYRAQASGKV